jgi:hypothetical protein
MKKCCKCKYWNVVSKPTCYVSSQMLNVGKWQYVRVSWHFKIGAVCCKRARNRTNGVFVFGKIFLTTE